MSIPVLSLCCIIHLI